MVARGCRWPILAILRTICGLCADWGHRSRRLGHCPDDSTRPHTRRSLSDCAGRRKGAARPCGMGLRPTLPPALRSRRRAGYGRRGGPSADRPVLSYALRADVIDPLVAMAGPPTTIGRAGGCPRTRPARCATGRSAVGGCGKRRREPLQRQMRPVSWAHMATSTRFRAPSFRMRLARWALTVLGVM